MDINAVHRKLRSHVEEHLAPEEYSVEMGGSTMIVTARVPLPPGALPPAIGRFDIEVHLLPRDSERTRVEALVEEHLDLAVCLDGLRTARSHHELLGAWADPPADAALLAWLLALEAGGLVVPPRDGLWWRLTRPGYEALGKTRTLPVP